MHPPTVYFPLLVDEALMIEPTETEPKERLDHFADAIRSILEEAKDDPEVARNAPYTDAGAAARRGGRREAPGRAAAALAEDPEADRAGRVAARGLDADARSGLA